MDEYLSDKLLKISAVFSTENLECLKMKQNDILIKQNWLIIKN